MTTNNNSNQLDPVAAAAEQAGAEARAKLLAEIGVKDVAEYRLRVAAQSPNPFVRAAAKYALGRAALRGAK